MCVSLHRLQLKIYAIFVQHDFFNWASPENVSRLASLKFAWTGPPFLNFLGVGIIFTSPDTSSIFDHGGEGEQSGTLTFS